MKIVGEKLNGTLARVRAAIESRNAAFIQELALAQVEAGVDWLDVNAGTSPERELGDLLWLIDCVQSVTEVPVCLDSANPEPLAQAVCKLDHSPMVNSISLERRKVAEILPVVREYQCDVIALAMDDNGMPQTVEQRLEIIGRLLELTDRAGIPLQKVYIDPLLMGAATNTNSGQIALDTIRATSASWPGVHFCAGLSNISFGLPQRSIINQAFVSLAIGAGLDTAILDPLDRELRGAILATELVLGRDRHCQNYTRAAKKQAIGRQRQA